MRRSVFSLLLFVGLAGCTGDSGKSATETGAGGQDASGDSGSQDSGSQDSGSQDTAGSDVVWSEDCPVDEAEQRLVDLGHLTLNVACRGAGPTILFLHGFPEFWYGWDALMDELASEYRLIAPDQRGYNLSDKPESVDEYVLSELISDIAALVPLISDEPILLVGHDWGGPVAWGVAHHHPELFRGMVGINAPHPNVIAHLLATDEEQQAASSYMDFFRSKQAEVALEYNDYAIMTDMFGDALTDEDVVLYKEAWGQKGALTGGLNWYRANDLSSGEFAKDVSYTIDRPTLVLWGLGDTALLPQNLDGLDAYVSDLQVVEYDDVDHWIAHHIPEQLAEEIRGFEASLK